MSRVIKFRAFDKERKEIIPVKLMDFSQWWVSCDPTHGQATPLEYGERNSFKNEQTDRHILMQYTGLKDRNGTGDELYEGDVIQVETNGVSRVEIRVICFDSNQACYKGVPISAYILNSGNGDWTGYSLRDNCERVGTIYENPELLRGE